MEQLGFWDTPWEEWLSQALEKPVELTFTRNRSTMVSYRESQGVLRVRLNQSFRKANRDVRVALVGYLKNHDRRASRILNQFILERPMEIETPELTLRTQGAVHNLRHLFGELNSAFFHQGCSARITWGQASRKQRRRSIQLGVYVRELNLIRIHPSLDQGFVPRFFVGGIVFHEMLHEVFGVGVHQGRRAVHPPEFMALEEAYPHFAACRDWERKNVHRLLAYRPAIA